METSSFRLTAVERESLYTTLADSALQQMIGPAGPIGSCLVDPASTVLGKVPKVDLIDWYLSGSRPDTQRGRAK